MSYYSEEIYSKTDGRMRFYSIFYKKGQKILDVGIGGCNFMNNDPDNIVGVDIDNDLIIKARKRGLNVMKVDESGKLPFSDNVFDAVNCLAVLEHMKFPSYFLKEALRVLKPGGQIVIEVPNIYKWGFMFWDDYTHRNPQTPDCLKHILFDAGFKRINVFQKWKELKGIAWAYEKGLLPKWLLFHFPLKSKNMIGVAYKDTGKSNCSKENKK